MEIRPLDPNEPSQFGQYADIHRRALEFENPYATPFSPAELHVQLARPNPAERLAPFAGYDGDVMVAAGLAVYWLIDNTEKVRHDVWVAPKHWRKGFGSAMEELLVDEARRQGRTTLLADFGFPFDSDDSYPSRRFAARHGFTLANYEVHRILDLPVDNAFLDELVAAAEPFHRDYELREYVDDIPDELVPSYCDLINSLMTDAPSGDIDYESGAITPGIFQSTGPPCASRDARCTSRSRSTDTGKRSPTVSWWYLLRIPATSSSGRPSYDASTAATDWAWPPRLATSASCRRPIRTGRSCIPGTLRATPT